jgi:signal peptidase I
MEPTLLDGQRLLVNKLAYQFSSPQRGDIVVFHAPRESGKDLVKRIIGLPGEKVEVRGGRVYINDQLLQESYLPRAGAYSWGPRIVGPD